MTRRERRGTGKSKVQGIILWFNKNRHLVGLGSLLLAAVGTVITVVVSQQNPEGTISARHFLYIGPISHREECTADGWFLAEEFVCE